MKLRCNRIIWIFILTLMIGSACSVSDSEVGSPDTLGVDCQSQNMVPGADLRNCDLSDTELSYANLEGANLQGANLRNASLFKANFKQANLKGVNLDDTPLVWVNFSEANLQGASLVGASLQGVNFRNADLAGADLTNVELIDVDFTGANLTGADGTNVTVSRVKLPDGTLVNLGWGEPGPGSTSAFIRATNRREESKGDQTAKSILGIFNWILGALTIALIFYFLPKKIATRRNNIPLFLGLIGLLMDYIWWNMTDARDPNLWGLLFYLSIVPCLVGLISGFWLIFKKNFSPSIIAGTIICFIALLPHLLMFTFAVMFAGW